MVWLQICPLHSLNTCTKKALPFPHVTEKSIEGSEKLVMCLRSHRGVTAKNRSRTVWFHSLIPSTQSLWWLSWNLGDPRLFSGEIKCVDGCYGNELRSTTCSYDPREGR